MKKLACVYCEGNDIKFAVLGKEKSRIEVIRAVSFDVVRSGVKVEEKMSSLNLDEEEFKLEGLDTSTESVSSKAFEASQGLISAAMRGINLSDCNFIPALTEPALYFHIVEDVQQRDKPVKVVEEIINDIKLTKNVTVRKENLGYVELAGRAILSVFLTGEVSCIKLINDLAKYNGKRYYKIPSVKSAEISLAYYVAKRKKFFPDDHSLIVYIGKEYSKLIFLHGRKIQHIGSTIDIGTTNLHTYDVYFSKILLEMENGGISSLDNIVVCGEDDSENLILSFYGTFPEANVSRLEFDDLDISGVDSKTAETMSSFSVPIAIATDYFDEQEGLHTGINLLPKYVKEDQKTLQFAWHGYVLIPLLFGAALLVTTQTLKNDREITKLNNEISEKTVLLRQNQEILGNITQLESKIASFGQTQAILDSASAGTGVYSKVLQQVSDFFAGRKNIWITKMGSDATQKIVVEGYALNKYVLTDFAYSIENAQLKSVTQDVLREKNVYKFLLNFSIDSFKK
jgi:hypothetical protein